MAAASAAIKIVEVLLLIIISIGALIGNIMLFILVAKTPGLQRKGYIFILNLAAADLLVASIIIPITIITVISEDWILGEKVCLVSGFFTLLTLVASCMSLSMISLNRYHAVVRWTTYRTMYTRWKCAIYVMIVWTITIGLSLPPFFGWAKFSFDNGKSYCFAEWSNSQSYTIFMITACLLCPLIIMAYCYHSIFRFHKKSLRMGRVAATSGNIRLNCRFHQVNRVGVVDGSCACCRQTAFAWTAKRLTRTIIMLIAVFAFCWIPYAVVIAFEAFTPGTHVPRYINFSSLLLGYMNSFCNVFVYNVTNKKVRDGFRKLICRNQL